MIKFICALFSNAQFSLIQTSKLTELQVSAGYWQEQCVLMNKRLEKIREFLDQGYPKPWQSDYLNHRVNNCGYTYQWHQDARDAFAEVRKLSAENITLQNKNAALEKENKQFGPYQNCPSFPAKQDFPYF